MLIDTSTEFGQRVTERLRDEDVVWLTTVTASGQPIPVPVWFLWDGEDGVLIYSYPNTPKLRNIEQNPRVSLNFDSDGFGGNIVQFDGEARIEHDGPPAIEVPEMLEKYDEGIRRLGMTPESFSDALPARIWVQLTKLRGH